MSDAVAQIRSRLVLDARVIITDHWPLESGEPSMCPVCNLPWMCWPMAVAYAYLRLVGQDIWTPPGFR